MIFYCNRVVGPLGKVKIVYHTHYLKSKRLTKNQINLKQKSSHQILDVRLAVEGSNQQPITPPHPQKKELRVPLAGWSN